MGLATSPTLRLVIMRIENVDKSDYPELLEVWESAVRATHDFLKEEDIVFLRPLIFEQYLDAVELRCAKNEHGKILGFCGVAASKLEMLFVLPENRRQGIGSLLCGHAIKHMMVRKVDVNEQNQQTICFYEYLGFRITGRSPMDGQGKPFPLLHMERD